VIETLPNDFDAIFVRALAKDPLTAFAVSNFASPLGELGGTRSLSGVRPLFPRRPSPDAGATALNSRSRMTRRCGTDRTGRARSSLTRESDDASRPARVLPKSLKLTVVHVRLNPLDPAASG